MAAVTRAVEVGVVLVHRHQPAAALRHPPLGAGLHNALARPVRGEQFTQRRTLGGRKFGMPMIIVQPRACRQNPVGANFDIGGVRASRLLELRVVRVDRQMIDRKPAHVATRMLIPVVPTPARTGAGRRAPTRSPRRPSPAPRRLRHKSRIPSQSRSNWLLPAPCILSVSRRFCVRFVC